MNSTSLAEGYYPDNTESFQVKMKSCLINGLIKMEDGNSDV